jgi:hypothetical protein
MILNFPTDIFNDSNYLINKITRVSKINKIHLSINKPKDEKIVRSNRYINGELHNVLQIQTVTYNK